MIVTKPIADDKFPLFWRRKKVVFFILFVIHPDIIDFISSIVLHAALEQIYTHDKEVSFQSHLYEMHNF